jgi:hypothetical protein
MLAGREKKLLEADSEPGAPKAASRKTAQPYNTLRLILLPHKRAGFRYDPPVFD